MRWIPYSFLALIVITLQAALAPRLTIYGVRPDWLLVFIVYFALFAPRFEAVLGAWVIGAVADLMTIERMGLMSLTYAMAAVIVIAVRDFVFRDDRVTQCSIVFVVGAVVHTLWLLYCRTAWPDAEAAGGVLQGIVLPAAYTTLFAWPAYRWLERLGSWFGLPRPKYTYRGSLRVGRPGG